MADHQRRTIHSCIRCGKQIKSLDSHIRICKLAIEGADYIKCKICNKKFAALYVHCKSHGLSSVQYQEQFGTLMCSETEKRVSERNSATQQKSNYRNKLKNEGKFDELQIYNEAVGRKVSEVILSSSTLRKIRSDTLTNLNKTDKFRKKASETAIKTSAKKNIQIKRSENLKQWRINNPEKFNKIMQSMHKFQSMPEKELWKQIQNNFPNLQFKRNQQLNRKNVFKINKSGIKQLDIYSKLYSVIIEFDGILHFKNIKKWNQLELIQQKDKEINSLHDEFCIIRVSYDQFSYHKSDFGFLPECLDKIFLILKNIKPGLHSIGSNYV